MDLPEGDLSTKCRICLVSKDNMNPLFEPFYEGFSLAGVLFNITCIQIEDNSVFPNRICNNCTTTITNFKKLIATCQESQICLQKLVTKKEEITELNDECDNLERDGYLNHELDKEYNKDIDLMKEVSSVKYECKECGDCFLLKRSFTHHMTQKHNISYKDEEYNNFGTLVSVTVPEESRKVRYCNKLAKSLHCCQICKLIFSDPSDLKQHYDIHKIHKCENCSATFIKKSYLKDHLLMHSSEKKFSCKDCGKSFKYRNGLAVHRNTHDNYKGFMCDVCGVTFNTRNTLKTHIKLKHIGEKNYPCLQCNLSFKVKSWLDRHCKRKHTDNRQKEFNCSICGIAYLNKTTLTRHINTKHTGTSKRHYCAVCQISYTMKNKLFRHMQNKHNVIDFK